uniref:Uncharacterized protein n=1 Tax=Coccidioides posadasii RMSCC 3488 TaxID=454284 RepID=A0A0J6F824_COCPO|nr:hypothetical protein CPAG_05448 [Coccidioides posadasii RMSCC 3488]
MLQCYVALTKSPKSLESGRDGTKKSQAAKQKGEDCKASSRRRKMTKRFSVETLRQGVYDNDFIGHASRTGQGTVRQKRVLETTQHLEQLEQVLRGSRTAERTAHLIFCAVKLKGEGPKGAGRETKLKMRIFIR